MSKKKSFGKKVKKANRRFVSGSKKIVTRGLLAGVGLLAFSPLEDTLLGPVGAITAPFTGVFGLGLIGASLLLPDEAVSNLFLRATGVARVMEGGEAPARRRDYGGRYGRGRYGYDDGYGGYGGYGGYSGPVRRVDDDDYDRPARRSGRGLLLGGGLSTLALLGAAGVGLVLWQKNRRRRLEAQGAYQANLRAA